MRSGKESRKNRKKYALCNPTKKLVTKPQELRSLTILINLRNLRNLRSLISLRALTTERSLRLLLIGPNKDIHNQDD